VHEAIQGRLKATFEDLGRMALKNIERPVHAYRVRWQSNDWPLVSAAASPPAFAAPALPGASLPLPDKPSIAVLPFANMSGDPGHHFFLAGTVTDGLIVDLSRDARLSVVSGANVARYLVEGSVQPQGRRIRVNVQLIRKADGVRLWADRFDKLSGDALDLQDEIVERIGRAVSVQVREAEIARAGRTQETDPDAETLILLARRAFTRGFCRANSEQAANLYQRALALDDKNAFAHCMLSITRTALHLMNWSEAPDHERRQAIHHRDRASELEPALPWCLVASGWILLAEGKFQPAVAAFARIAEMSPSAGGNAYANLAMAKNFVGRSDEAESELLRAIRVFPGEPQIDIWHYYLGVARTFLGKYGEAAEALRTAVSLNPELDAAYILLAALEVAAGSVDDASAAIRQAQALGTRWTVRTLKASILSGAGVGLHDSRMMALWDGLRSAGLPE
jgi:adenylate cyclase